MTTKEQERKALEQIKKILAGLGEDSYVGTAMEGMIEDAEDNIENDWAMSRYGAWQDAEQKADKLAAKVEMLQKELQAANERIDDLKAKVLTEEENRMASNLLGSYRLELNSEAERMAKQIVAYADDVENHNFTDAVWRHRKAQAAEEKTVQVLEALRIKR